MKQIIALQEYSDKIISLYEGEIRNIETELANKLIAQGIVAEHDQTGGDCGYKSTIQNQTIIDGTYQFTSQSGPLDGATGIIISELYISAEDKITVFFDEIKYELPRIIDPNIPSNTYYYGEIDSRGVPSFNNFPIFIISMSGSKGGTLITTNNPTEATHTVKIETSTETITTTELFRKAIQSITIKNIKDDSSLNGGVVAGAITLNQATGNFSFAEGSNTIASGKYSHAEGSNTTSSEDSSHAEGGFTNASGQYSHTEGNGTAASKFGSHAEGIGATASGDSSHAEGNATTASGSNSHAEGSLTTASEFCSHAEGNSTNAFGNSSHAEGYSTTASGESSHAEGSNTAASGNYSHAQNYHTVAQGQSQTVIGKYNKMRGTPTSSTSTDYAFIIGNGTSNTNRSNALAIKWDGTFVFANGTEISPAQFQSLLALLDTQDESGQG